MSCEIVDSKAPRAIPETVSLWAVSIRIEQCDFDNKAELDEWLMHESVSYCDSDRMFTLMSKNQFKSKDELDKWQHESVSYRDLNRVLTLGTSAEDAKARIKSRIMELKTLKPRYDPISSEYHDAILDMPLSYAKGLASIAPYKKAALKALERAEIEKIDQDTIFISTTEFHY